MNGLVQIIESEFDHRILETSWFVFIARNKKTVKLIYWRGCGLAMWQYRLEDQSFILGRPRLLLTKTITWKDLERFLDGFNIFEGEPHKKIILKRHS